MVALDTIGRHAEAHGGVLAMAGKTITPKEREFLIDNLLVRVYLIIEMILVDRHCAMGVGIVTPIRFGFGAR